MEEIKQQLEDCKTKEEIQSKINELFPNWLHFSLEKYSADYPHLQQNWEKICSMTNTTPKKIILVEDIIFDENNLGKCYVCEFLTKRGYVVRRIEEFLACPKCMSAIPSLVVYRLMKEKNIPVPSVWSSYCKGCEE